MKTLGVRVRALAFAVVCGTAFALGPGQAAAQHDATPDGSGTAPPPPAGDGRVVVQIVNRDRPEDVASIPVALYALTADGRPGFTNGETDDRGQVAFANVSSDPAIVYLVGARYRDIPFGARVAFAAGARQAETRIEVSTPTDRADAVRVEELRIRLDWQGERVLVRELLRLVNPGERVIQLPQAGAGGGAPRAILARPIGDDVADFAPGAGSAGDRMALEAGLIRYAGPLYPGDQQIEWQYTLPRPSAGRALVLPIELDRAASRVVAVAGTPGMTISGEGFVAASDVSSDSGLSLSAWARGPLPAGARSALSIGLPETRSGPDLVTLPRADLWLDLDDTRLTATADFELSVAAGTPVAGTPEAPLLSIRLPEGARLTGVAPEAEALGLVPRDHGGFDVVGPIGEGTTRLGYAYHLDAKPEGVALDLRFPRAVATLNVLVADTGLAVESGRLHRLRPFRSGTRNYLHREAFHVEADEVVDVRLAPLAARGLPRELGLAFAFAAIFATAAFLVAPLSRRARGEASVPDDAATRLREEREAVYVAIRDLDHDLETGKLEPDHHAAMRESLRARAIELLAHTRDGAARDGADRVDPARAPDAPPASAAHPPRSAPGPAADAPARFCPSCGAAREPRWQFCASCGAPLPPAPESAA